MSDLLETPLGDFEWGPHDRFLSRIHYHLPAMAIGAGLVLDVVGVVWLIHG